MSLDNRPVYAGGCQCGAIRYRIEGPLEHAHICHCRMCQKAAGNYFMPLARTRRENFHITRGKFGWFRSSDPVRRGFCADCGTPLVFETIGAPNISITLGSLDEPAQIRPLIQYGTEARMPWFADLADMPGRTTEDDAYQEGVSLADITATNHQHPDHDTSDWPAGGENDA